MNFPKFICYLSFFIFQSAVCILPSFHSVHTPNLRSFVANILSKAELGADKMACKEIHLSLRNISDANEDIDRVSSILPQLRFRSPAIIPYQSYSRHLSSTHRHGMPSKTKALSQEVKPLSLVDHVLYITPLFMPVASG